MADSDLNLLTALDALLAEGSVVGAARRLRLSSSAMSGTLAQLALSSPANIALTHNPAKMM